MSLQLKFTTSLSTDGKSLRFTETTGAYDSVLNPNGWGVSGSPTLASIDSCKIYIVNNNNVQYTIDVISYLPSATNDFYNITSDDIGLSANTQIPDGVYTIKYEVGDISENTYISHLAYILVDREVKCCVFKKVEEILDICDSCQDKKLVNFMFSYALYKSLLYAVKLGRLTKAQEILTALQKYCSQSNCKC